MYASMYIAHVCCINIMHKVYIYIHLMATKTKHTFILARFPHKTKEAKINSIYICMQSLVD